jgi:hypothetical protein
MHKIKFTVLLVGAALLLGALSQGIFRKTTDPLKVSAASRVQTTPRPLPPKIQQTIYAPTIALKSLPKAEIVLSNNGIEEIEVSPAFYTSKGEPITGTKVILRPAEVRYTDASELIPVEHRSKSFGGLALSYLGRSMDLGAQIILSAGQGKPGSVDIPFSATANYPSAVQEAVWWMPSEGVAALALGNIGDTSISVRMDFTDGEFRQIELPPHVTEIVEYRKKDKQSGPASVRLAVSGALGNLRANGFVSSPADFFYGSIRFYDPRTSEQPQLFATNLKVGSAAAHLVLKNTSDSPVSARPVLIPLQGTAMGSMDLPSIEVPPHQAVSVDLSPLTQRAAKTPAYRTISVKVMNDGPSGSLIGALYSTDGNQVTTDIPLHDSGPARKSFGNHPVRLDRDYTTIVSITNVSQVAAKFIVSIRHEAGQYAVPKIQQLKVGETAVFDLRKMREEQIPDLLKRTLPKTMTTAIFHWGVHNASEGARLIGRAETVSSSQRVNSIHEGETCCGDSYAGGELQSLTTGQNFLDLPEGDNDVVESREYRRTCSGDRIGPFPGSFFTSFHSFDSDVIDGNMTGSVTAKNGGDTRIEACWSTDDWDSECVPISITAYSLINVAVTGVEITDSAGTRLNDTTQHVIVGQHINLRLRMKPSSRSFSSLSWEITGEHKKAWNVVPPSAPTDPNSTAAYVSTILNQTPVEFFWHDGNFNGQAETVTLKVTRNNTVLPSAKVNYRVYRPQVAVIAAKGRIAIGPIFTDPGLFLHYGVKDLDPGMKIVYSGVFIPLGLNGQWQWFQTFSADRKFGNSSERYGWMAYGLDRFYPTPVSTPNEFQDAPAQILDVPGRTFTTVNDNFDTYLMFKPDLTNAHWVPIKRIHWRWYGHATRGTFSGWELIYSENPNAVDFNQVEFPTWESNPQPNFVRLP